MNKTLTSIFETQGPVSLDISNQNFLEEDIFEEFIDSSFFYQVNFINCSFEECELVGVNFYFCVFEGCTFSSTIIRKSDFSDCVFKNCQFIESRLSPKTNFFRTLFINSQFSSVDLSFTFLCKCEFIKINLIKTNFKGAYFVDPKTEKITFNDLEFDKNKAMRIQITDSSFFPIEASFAFTEDLNCFIETTYSQFQNFQPKIDLDKLIDRSYKLLYSITLLTTGFLLVNF